MDEGQVRDVMQPLRAHQAVVVRFRGAALHGRIDWYEDAEENGAIVHVRTPGGSLCKVSRAWVRAADDADLAILKEFEFAARELSGGPIYDTSS